MHDFVWPPLWRSLTLILALLTVTYPITALSGAVPLSPSPLTLAVAQQQALTDNPRIAQISARYQAARQLPAQAGTLPDPTLKLGLLAVPVDGYALDQEAMTQLQLGISQPLPWFGKLDLARAVADHTAEASAAELEEARLMLVRDVSRSWWALYYVDRALGVVDENLQRLREFNRIAQSRYRVGKGLQQDALQAQLELSAQFDRQLLLQGQRRVLAAGLNTLMAVPADQPVQLADRVTPSLAPLPDLATLTRTAMGNHPRIRRQQRLLDAATDRRSLAEKGLYPDMTLGAAYGYRQDAPNGSSRADLLTLTLGVKLPLYANSKQQREIDQRGAERIAQQQALMEAQLATQNAITQAHSDYQQAQQRAALLKDGILPQAQQTVASMLAGYQVGKVDFTALVRAQLQVNQVQLQIWQTIRDAQQARADLIAAVGGSFNE